MSCCKPNQLRQSDLAALYRGLGQWSNKVILENRGSDKDLFLVDLDSDQPPLYRALYRETPGVPCRYINTTALVEHLQALKADTGSKPLSFDNNAGVPSSMLDHLITSLGSMSLRNFKRTTSNKPLWICVGLSSTHYHVAGERTFEHLLYGRDDALSVNKIAGGNRFLPSPPQRR